MVYYIVEELENLGDEYKYLAKYILDEKVKLSNKEILQKVQETINQSKVFLTMKGTPLMPECGFSHTVVEILNKYNIEYKSFNIFTDPELMQAMKDFANWPTTPMIFVKGKFIGGCDILQSLDNSGELKKILES